jgi:hypothetical protein
MRKTQRLAEPLVAALVQLAVASAALGDSVAPSTQPADPQATIKFIVVQCQTHLLAASNVSYSFQQICKTPEVTNTVIGSSIEDHSHGYERVKSDRTSKSNGEPEITFSETAFMGPTCSGHYVADSSVASEYQHSSPLSASERERNAMHAASSPHLEWSAFGEHSQSLLEFYVEDQTRPVCSKWEIQAAQKSDAAGSYRIARYERSRNTLPSKPTDLFVIDASKGFSIARLEERMPFEPCPLLHTYDITVSKFPGDRWYLTAVTDTYYGCPIAGWAGPEDVKWTVQTTLSNVSLGKAFDESEFGMGSLNLKQAYPPPV